MSISDVIIHIVETLSPNNRSTLENSLREIDGVIAPRFTPGKEHLLVVAFNPRQTQAASLLDVVGKAGHRAQLIGM